MRKKRSFKLFLGLVVILCLPLAVKLGVEFWLEDKIESALKNVYGHTIDIKRINISIRKSLLELHRVKVFSDPEKNEYYSEIRSVILSGLNYKEAILHKDIHIDEITIKKSSFKATIPIKKMMSSPVISPYRIDIGGISIDQFNIELENDSTGQLISLRNGSAKINAVRFSESDTISPRMITLSNFRAGEISLGSSDKLYSYKLKTLSYSPAENVLSADSFLVQPKYKNADFTARLKYQRSCFMAGFSKIRVHDFYIDSYLKPKTMKSSHVDLGEMILNVFRDNRKEFLHKRRPALQDIIYAIPLLIKIDSINLAKGKLIYTFHPEKTKAPVTFVINDIHAGILNLTNDKTKSGYLEIKAAGRIMGKSKLSVVLRGKLPDKNNTLSVDGSLQKLDMRDLNPILENSASVYVSGKVNSMKFSFLADNTRAAGKLTMLYDGLQITFRDKRSGDTTTLRSRILSSIANRRILDSNPLKRESARVGIIDCERDPERFLFHYCFRSILTGVSSTVVKNDKKNKRFVLVK